MTLLTPQGDPLQNPYVILGLERGASDDDVNKAFKRLMLKLHPDKQPAGQSEEEAAQIAETFHNVMAAKSFLLDSEHITAKRAYDSKLASIDRRTYKNNIPSFDKSAQSSGHGSKQDKPKRRASDCTDDRGPNLFKKTQKNRRASCDDCSTTSQSSSGDDVPHQNKTCSSPSHRTVRQTLNRKTLGPRHNDNSKPSRHQKSINVAQMTKKASSFSEGCSSFITDKDSKKFDRMTREKKQDRKHSIDHKKPSRDTILGKPPSQSHRVKPHLPTLSTFSTSLPSSPDAHWEAKQRITNSIEMIVKKFKCPLTKEIINDPLTDFEGNSYEREAILKYLDTHSASPVTGAPLYACHLTGDSALKEKIRCTIELKKTLDTLGAAQKKELEYVTKQHTISKTSFETLRESINSFISDLNSGSSAISFSTDGGITTFSYLGIKFKLEVSEVNSFTILTLFDHNKKAANISSRLVDWNRALQAIGLGGKLIFKNFNGTFIFCYNESIDPRMFKIRTFRYSIEYFLEFAIKLHNIINVDDLKTVGKIRLTA